MTSVSKALEEYPLKCCVCGEPFFESESIFSEKTYELCIICHQKFHFGAPPFRWTYQEPFVASGDNTRCGVQSTHDVSVDGDDEFLTRPEYFYLCAHCLHDKYGRSVEEFVLTPSTLFDSLFRIILILALALILVVLLGCVCFLAFGFLARFIAAF